MKGKTALQEACVQGINDIVLELFKHGADVSTRDSEGNSALHVSCIAVRVNDRKSLMLAWVLFCFSAKSTVCWVLLLKLLFKAISNSSAICLNGYFNTIINRSNDFIHYNH